MKDLGPYLTTVTGERFYYLHPNVKSINIFDIGYALSNQCRYLGHTNEFYSVAQHSVLVSTLVESEHALAGLLHDAAEAYTGDIVSPVKAVVKPIFADVEEKIEKIIAKKFGIEYPRDPSIKIADLVVAATEVRDLMPEGMIWSPVVDLPEPMLVPIEAWEPSKALALWMARYRELKGE